MSVRFCAVCKVAARHDSTLYLGAVRWFGIFWSLSDSRSAEVLGPSFLQKNPAFRLRSMTGIFFVRCRDGARSV